LEAKVQKNLQTCQIIKFFCENNCGASRDERKLLSAKALVSIQVDERLFSLAKVELSVAVLKKLWDRKLFILWNGPYSDSLMVCPFS